MQQRGAKPFKAIYVAWLKEDGLDKSNGYDDLLQASHIAPGMLNELENSFLSTM